MDYALTARASPSREHCGVSRRGIGRSHRGSWSRPERLHARGEPWHPPTRRKRWRQAVLYVMRTKDDELGLLSPLVLLYATVVVVLLAVSFYRRRQVYELAGAGGRGAAGGEPPHGCGLFLPARAMQRWPPATWQIGSGPALCAGCPALSARPGGLVQALGDANALKRCARGPARYRAAHPSSDSVRCCVARLGLALWPGTACHGPSSRTVTVSVAKGGICSAPTAIHFGEEHPRLKGRVMARV